MAQLRKFLADYWVPLLVLIAVLAAGYYVTKENESRNDEQTAQQIAGCIRGSERTALAAAFTIEAAKARAATGDEEVAKRYEAIARGQISKIPAPQGSIGDPHIAEIRQTKDANGKPIMVLTDEAAALQKRGCEEANAHS